MHQHLAGCPVRARLENRVIDTLVRPAFSVPLHRLSTAQVSSRPLTQQRLAVSCPAVEQDTEAPSTSGRRRTDSDLIHALFQTEQPTLADFADIELSDVSYEKDLRKRIKACSSLRELCDIIQLEAPHFTHKSASHGLYRLSILCQAYFTHLDSTNLTSREAQQAAWIEYVEPALQTLGQLLIRHMNTCDPWAVAISFWAYGNMQCSDEAVFAALCERGLQIMHDFTAHDCASALVGIAKLRVRPRCQREFVDYLLSHASDLLSRVDCWKTQEIANILWALSKVGAAGPSRRALLEGLLEMTMWRLPDFAIKEICLVIYSCGRLQLRMPLQLARITDHIAQRLPELRPLDAAHVLWGCAKLGFKPEGELLEQLPQVMVSRLREFKSQEISNMLYGYGSLRYEHPYLLESVAQACPQRLHEFSTQDVCLTIWSYGMLQYYPEGDDLFDTACRVLLQRSNRLIPVQITMAVKGFARAMYQPAPEFMQQISQLAIQKMHQFSPLELSQLLWAYAKLGYRDVQLFETAVATYIQTLSEGTRRLPKTTIDTVVRACELVGFWPQLLVDTAEMRGVIVKTTMQKESADMEQLLTVLPEAAVPAFKSNDAIEHVDGSSSSSSQSSSSGIPKASGAVQSLVPISADNMEAPVGVSQQSSGGQQLQQHDLHQYQQQQLDDHQQLDQQQQRPLPRVLAADALQQERHASSMLQQQVHQAEQHQQLQQQQQQQQQQHITSSNFEQHQHQHHHSRPLHLLRPPSRLHQQQTAGIVEAGGAAAAAGSAGGGLLQLIQPKHPLAVGSAIGRKTRVTTSAGLAELARPAFTGHAHAQLQ